MIRAFIGEYGVPTPVFFCDACHRSPQCQSATCHKAGHLRGMGTWDEIPDYLVKLAAGTGVFPEDLSQRYESLLQRGHVPDSEDSECSTS